MAERVVSKEKRTRIPWYEERDLVDQRWGRWTRSIPERGLRIGVSIMLDGHWQLLPRAFVFVYRDRLGSHAVLRVPRRLLRLDQRTVLSLAREHAARLRVGKCARCERQTILNRRSPTNHRGARLCESCYLAALDASAAEDSARQTAETEARCAQKKKRGFAYRLELWIHPKRGGDDYALERFYKKRPTGVEIEALARRSGSAVVDDFHVSRL